MSELQIVAIPRDDDSFCAEARRLAVQIPIELGTGDEARAWYERELLRSFPRAHVRPQEELARVERGTTIWYATNGDPILRIDTSVDVPLRQEQAYAAYVERVVEWQTAVRLTVVSTTPRLDPPDREGRLPASGFAPCPNR